MPSFERVDYSIRTNKNIERKLVFDKLRTMSSAFNFADYRYVGLGSMWFIDFIMAHRILSIRDLWSLEESNAERAEFNKPYACIRVLSGTSTATLDGLTGDDWQKRMIVWFDYDGAFDEDVRSNAIKLLERLAVGSIVIVTVNADRRSYRPPGPADQAARSIDRLTEVFGDAVPPQVIPEGAADIGAAEFPKILGSVILNLMIASVRTSGRTTEGLPDRFVPLFELQHRDGAQMTTCGGMVVSWRQLAPLEQVLGRPAAELFGGAAAIKENIDLIPLTIREKIALDRVLPCVDDAEFLQRLTASAVKVDAVEANKYRRWYRHFPVFAEVG